MLQPDLLSANVDFHDDLVRNIPSIRKSQNLFDDLSPHAADWDIAISAENAARVPSDHPIITRPFDYGGVVSYSFNSSNWRTTRFSDGSLYGVWYGSLQLETTVYETACHWTQFVQDSFAAEDREIVTERRAFDVRCDSLLIDLRGKQSKYPDIVNRASYAFTQQLGRYIHDQGQNGLLCPSARCAGDNAAIFRAARLSNVRDRTYLTYRLNLARDILVVERVPGQRWMRIKPSTLK